MPKVCLPEIKIVLQEQEISKELDMSLISGMAQDYFFQTKISLLLLDNNNNVLINAGWQNLAAKINRLIFFQEIISPIMMANTHVANITLSEHKSEVPARFSSEEIYSAVGFYTKLVQLFFKLNQGHIALKHAEQNQSYIKKQMELEQIELKAQLFHSSKLAELGTFAAGIAHEINNPMALISGHVEIITKNCKSICLKDNFDRLNKIRSTINRTIEIIYGLRTYARRDIEIIENIDVHACINETLSLAESIFEVRSIQIKKNLHAENFWTKACVGKIQQVIMNLVGNAKDALADTSEGIIEVSTYNIEHGLCLKISDNGPGIPEHILARIFDPFFTTKGPEKGTGLGLSICKKIIESFNGQLNVESSTGHGAAFVITLPVIENVTVKKEIVQDDPDEEFQISGNALVVDDNGGMRELLAYYLASMGLNVHEAEDGEKALEKIMEMPFDYVVTDMQMPKMNGEELLHKIKTEVSADIKVLVVTGDIGDQCFKKMSPDGYIYKPFLKIDLINSFKLLK